MVLRENGQLLCPEIDVDVVGVQRVRTDDPGDASVRAEWIGARRDDERQVRRGELADLERRGDEIARMRGGHAVKLEITLPARKLQFIGDVAGDYGTATGIEQ